MTRIFFSKRRKKAEPGASASSQESSRLFEGPESSGGSAQAMAGDGGEECSDGSPPAADSGAPRMSDEKPGPPQRLGSTVRTLSKKFSVSGDGASKGKVCLICLESLDECDSGEAIALDCECRGDIRWRHLKCQMKWAQIKGSSQCDICKTRIKNLPDIEGLPPPDLVEPVSPQEAFYFSEEAVPPALDLSFDFLRITWIATIVCVLFVQLDLQESLWIGSIVGLAYILVVKAVECCSNRMRRFQAEDNSPGPTTTATGRPHTAFPSPSSIDMNL